MHLFLPAGPLTRSPLADAALTSLEALLDTTSAVDASTAVDGEATSSLENAAVESATLNAVDISASSTTAPSFADAASSAADVSSLPLDSPSSTPSTVSSSTAPLWTSAIPHSVSLVSRCGAHLTPAPSAPAKPYVVPSTLIAHVAHRAKTQYDSSTAIWLRRRTKRILQLMESHMSRIQGVLEVLEEGPGAAAAVDAEDGSAHRQRLADPALGRRDALRRTPAVRRKERQVLHARMILVRHRIQKLRDVDGLKTGDAEHDRWVAEYRRLKAMAFPAEQQQAAPQDEAQAQS